MDAPLEIIMAHLSRSLAGLGTILAVATLAAPYECLAASPEIATAAQRAQSMPTLSTGPAPADTNTNKQLRAAAEPFEKLTEISFSAALPTIDQAISEAEKTAQGVHGSLSNNAAHQLDAQLSAVKSARQKQDRAGLALASIEAYRVLVSAVTSTAKVPTEVSVLDYAGFRYDADLKASPIRWRDMAQAVLFARENWDKLLPRIKSSPIAKDFDTALTHMDTAVTQQSESLAASSVQTELDLVDKLESFFLAH